MLVQKIQQVLDSITRDENEQEAFIMLGLIFSLLFFAIVGIATGQTLALIL
ncbi:MAG: hypothetical protein Q4G27_06620 [Flavobacteriaceae bacterium]|nr:hypothetical protein [Flavobacteriaceae bacterium]